ncbi:potassium channel family protein [Virgibacillus kekensis]|uniref:Potassium channel family protein n=1 Tax=Virgibacillus kekensis TaxID=202261 RepID=A0ABV9DJ66_9BACI
MNIETFKHIYFRLPTIVRLLLTILFVMVLFGVTIHIIEPDEFPSIFDGIWWAFVTGATVGYGDYVPLTPVGRIIGILLILSGGGLLTFYIATLSAATVDHERDLSKGKVSFKGNNHIIIVGWNERTRQLVQMINSKDNTIEMVLIDRSLDHLPYKHFPVHFIHGDPSEDATLVQANVEKAASVMITSDITKTERQADIATILAIIAIRGNNPVVPINAEILSLTQADNAIRAGADTIISSNDFMSTLFYHELFHNEDTKPFDSILHLLNNQQFVNLPVPEQLVNKSFKEASIFFLNKRELLTGVIRDNEWIMNPVNDFQIKEKDTLITLTAWK